MEIHLMVIDGQNDFVDPNGSLYVKGADEDAKRLAAMIERLDSGMQTKLDDIHLTMDSHRIVDISHPIWWVDDNGNNPDPFTIITAADMDTGKWRTFKRGAQNRSYEYLRALEASGRYPHCIWPEHCKIGDQGYCIHPVIAGAVHAWERKRFAMGDMVTKGSNPWTEHFSAVKAEVPDPNDPSTQLNVQLVQNIQNADLVLWSGWALSHCLAHTARDTFAAFTDPSIVSKMVLLSDATSSVPGFEKYGDDFIRDMKALGMRIETTTSILA